MIHLQKILFPVSGICRNLTESCSTNLARNPFNLTLTFNFNLVKNNPFQTWSQCFWSHVSCASALNKLCVRLPIEFNLVNTSNKGAVVFPWKFAEKTIKIKNKLNNLDQNTYAIGCLIPDSWDAAIFLQLLVDTKFLHVC